MKRNNPIRKFSKCRGCGKKIPLWHVKYCLNCAKLLVRLRNNDISAKYRKAVWAYLRKYGFRCYYTGMLLEIDDNTSPWYLVFGRRVPGDDSTIIITSALLNEMKSQLTEKQFWFYVLALDNYRRKHLEVKKIPLVNWRLYPSIDNNVCTGCGRAMALKGREFCASCARLEYRMEKARFPREAIQGVWDYLHKYGFVCYYTGMPLDLDDPKSPWYLVFDHWMPRDPRKIVITSTLVNVMKSDLTEEEFWYFIRQFANYRRYGKAVRKRKLAYWSRPYRWEDR